MMQSVFHRNKESTHTKYKQRVRLKNIIPLFFTVVKLGQSLAFKKTGNEAGNLKEVIQWLG